MKDTKTLEALERAIKASEECYFAFNHLAIITRVDFIFSAKDLLNAWNLCKAWAEALKKEGE